MQIVRNVQFQVKHGKLDEFTKTLNNDVRGFLCPGGAAPAVGQSSDSLRLTGDLGVVGFDRDRVAGIARQFEEGTDIGVHCSGVPATGSPGSGAPTGC